MISYLTLMHKYWKGVLAITTPRAFGSWEYVQWAIKYKKSQEKVINEGALTAGHKMNVWRIKDKPSTTARAFWTASSGWRTFCETILQCRDLPQSSSTHRRPIGNKHQQEASTPDKIKEMRDWQVGQNPKLMNRDSQAKFESEIQILSSHSFGKLIRLLEC